MAAFQPPTDIEPIRLVLNNAEELAAPEVVTLGVGTERKLEPLGDEGGDDGLPPTGVKQSVPHSHDQIAREVSDHHRSELLYVKHRGQWLIWDGKRFTEDTRNGVLRAVRRFCRRHSQEIPRDDKGRLPRLARELASEPTVAHVERLLRSDRRHAAAMGDFDQSNWLLNTPGGAVDLRDGSIRPATRGDRFTKLTAVAPDMRGLLASPTFAKVLDQVTCGDGPFKANLQRIFGYCATGSVRENAVFFIHGPGGNGKTCFIESIRWILGDYSHVAAMDLFLTAKGERHPTELAALYGRRLVVASETEAGGRFNSSRIKNLSGGEAVMARFMRQDEFSFDPICKIVMVGNHLPALNSVDPAVRRRFHVLPFMFQIIKPDAHMRDRLRAEAAGILGWLVKGARLWHEEGLAPCEVVRKASGEYLDGEDTVGRWIAERCEVGLGRRETTKALHADFVEWAGQAGERPLSEQRLKQALMQRPGVKDWRSATARGLDGIRLLLEPKNKQAELSLDDGRERGVESAVEREPGEEG